MFRLISKIRRSLPTQITLWVVGFALIIVCVSLFLMSRFSQALVSEIDDSGLMTLAVVLAVVSLIIITLLCWMVVAHHLRPLRLLAESMQCIANGQMKGKVEESGNQDEIGQFQNSFAKMQSALASYVTEMEQKRNTLSQQNVELQAAYEQTQELDNIKMQFLGRMTNQMAQNIESITAMTDTICNRYHQLSKTEMMKMQVEMLSLTDTVTRLLSKMLDNPKEKDRP